MYAIQTKDVIKQYDYFTLQNISFDIKKGCINGLIGPNGSGKSTTIKLILNLLRRDSGDIQVFGYDNQKLPSEVKERIGFVHDENYYYNHLTILETKRLVSSFYKRWDNKLFEQYIKTFNLPWKKRMKDLSKGMKMKFSIAVALSHHADLIIMDEPTSGLDPIFRRELLDILADLAQEHNKTIFLSTHIISDLERIADYITIMNRGKIVLSCSKNDILRTYTLVKGRIEALEPNIRQQFLGIRQSSLGFEGIIERKLATSLLASDIKTQQPTLEDVMYYIVKGERNV